MIHQEYHTDLLYAYSSKGDIKTWKGSCEDFGDSKVESDSSTPNRTNHVDDEGEHQIEKAAGPTPYRIWYMNLLRLYIISTCCITLPNISHFKCGTAFVSTQYTHIHVSIMNEFWFIIMELITPI